MAISGVNTKGEIEYPECGPGRAKVRSMSNVFESEKPLYAIFGVDWSMFLSTPEISITRVQAHCAQCKQEVD